MKSPNKYFKAKLNNVGPSIMTRQTMRRSAFRAELARMPTHAEDDKGRRIPIDRKVRREMARLAVRRKRA